MASAACIKIAGVPVELKVATILLAIKALLPTPVITTLPLDCRIQLTAAANSAVKRLDKFFMALPSVSMALLAIPRMDESVFKVSRKLFVANLKECIIFKNTKLNKHYSFCSAFTGKRVQAKHDKYS